MKKVLAQNFYAQMGSNIRRIRKANRYSRPEFASLIGVTGLTLLTWERGKSKIPTHVALQLRDMFHVSIDQIIPNQL